MLGSGRPESMCASQSAPREIMGCFGGRTTASSRIVVLFMIARSCMNDICAFWGWLETWKLESSNEASGSTQRAKARPSQDGRRGLQIQRGRDIGWVPTGNPNRFHYLEQGDFQEQF